MRWWKYLALLFVLALAACSEVGGGGSDEARSALEEALLGPEGEYAAYAAYDAVIAKYGEVEPYLSIREAERRHYEALEKLFDKYGLSYPAENPYLGELKAPESLEEAARAWAEGEVKNIEMYDRLLPQVEGYPDITRVFENLRRASEEVHLPCFNAAAERGGTLTQEEMQEFCAPKDRGRGRR